MNKELISVIKNQSELNVIVDQVRSDITTSDVYVLSVETPSSFTSPSIHISGYSTYSSNTTIYKEDGTSLTVKLFIFIKN